MATSCELLPGRIRTGDRAAEAELVEYFEPRIRALAIARGIGAEAAGDVVQDALLAVLCAIRQGRLERDASVAGFVYGTARNLVSANMRERARRREEPLVEDLALAIAAQDHLRAEQLRQARNAILGLPPQDRELLRQVLVDGAKPAEIAARMGVSSEVIRARKSRALKKVVESVKRLSRRALSRTLPCEED